MPTDPLRCRPAWLLALACFFVLMLALGNVPGEAQVLSARYGDKLLHALAYGFMALLCHRALPSSTIRRLLATIAVIAMLGLLDESLQSLLPYRNASLLDWCFDIGAAAMVAVLLALHAHFFLAVRTHA
ncbi:MAG: VanZ family protein [Pseudomonadota bacterium]|jgi:VanZ family protein